MFPTRNGTWKAPNNVRRQWRAARKGTGFEWVVPHTFRKTVATIVDKEMGELGAKAVKENLGHSDEKVGQDYYVAKPLRATDVSSVLHAAFAPASEE